MTAAHEPLDSTAEPSWPDLRQSPAALEIQRGVVRLLQQHAFACVTELALPNGRRADVVGLSDKGELWIVEIKSSIQDFRVDQKWPEYRDYCDRLHFAVKPDFPTDILPADTGLILADRYGGEIVRGAPETRLAAARRTVMTRLFARTAAFRLASVMDPALPAIVEGRGGQGTVQGTGQITGQGSGQGSGKS